MFCPKCGKADQFPETYCRQCGVFLPDLSKPLKQHVPPEVHVKVNTVLSAMTIVASFTLAILLYSMLAFRENTHPLIYVTAGVLIAIGIWQIQTLSRSLLLRNHFKRIKPPQDDALDGGKVMDKWLKVPDFESMVPASVTDRTTKQLAKTKIKSS